MAIFMHTQSKNKHWSARYLTALLIAVTLASLAGCATLGQTKLAASVDEKGQAQVDALEKRLPGLINRPDPAVRRDLENDINQLLGSSNYNKAYQARLWGLLAETAWLYQDRPLLDNAIRHMQQLDPDQAYLVIARSRLAKPADRIALLQTAINANPDKAQPAIKLELALVYEAQKSYREAAAAFDDAFATLDPIWINLYREKRNAAYRQKDLPLAQSRRESQWLAQETVNRESLIGLALLRSPYLDRYGKESANQLAGLNQKLEQDQLLPKGEPAGPATAILGVVQTRSTAAWFLFHIAVIQENRPDLLTGGKAWKTSPIPDLSLDDPAFRAVLGVVQREILNLPDGSNFHPLDALLTSDYLKALDRLHELYP